MNTTDERVEITPELLAEIERNAGVAADVHDYIRAEYKRITICGHPAFAVVLALVARIRELESKERQLEAAEEHIRVLSEYIRDPHASTVCTDRAAFDPRCGGCDGCITLHAVHGIRSSARQYDTAGSPLAF